MVDEHYYSSPNWFINNATMYDKRDRNDPPVYIAEVAVTTNEGGRDRGNLQAALAEGVYLMGCERNSDVVRMVSYAPLLANVDGRTPLAGAPPAWHGMIYFDSSRVFGTASYHLWKMFGTNVPTHTVATEVTSSSDDEPVSGAIGLGTWGTSAEFKDVRIEKAGEAVHVSDFSNGQGEWKPEGGRWSVEDGVYRQGRPSISFSRIGNADWSDYTLTLKARKLQGPEGFVIMFGSKGDDRLWWNLGGWGNREHGVELNQSPVGDKVQGTIETGRWYDVKVELSGRKVKCYLDGHLVHDVTVPATRTLHSVAGIDQSSGELILKVINSGTKSAAATFDIAGSEYRASTPVVSVLTSASPRDNNSLDEPLKVKPASLTAPSLAENASWEFPPSSLTIIRIKK
jgi:alpha-L-arabinofuranosidase